MQQIKIYLELSDELQEVLNDNAISIEDILEQEVRYGVMPTQAEEGARSKDIVGTPIRSKGTGRYWRRTRNKNVEREVIRS